MEIANIVAVDTQKDLALLHIANPRSKACLKILKSPVAIGTPCGSLGFPLAQVGPTPQGISFNLVERFQGANISALVTTKDPNSTDITFYETDSLMYAGSSGCPGFLVSGDVFGMHNRSVLDSPQTGQQIGGGAQSTRLAISMWVTSMDIVAFASAHGVKL